MNIEESNTVMGKYNQNKSPEEAREFIINKVVVDEITGCWNVMKCLDEYGYAIMRFYGKVAKVHRVSYWAFTDSNFRVLENAKELICHSCDNKRCVNPKHLFVGTTVTNAEDHFLKKLGKLNSLHRRELCRGYLKKFKEVHKYDAKPKYISKNEIEKINIDINL